MKDIFIKYNLVGKAKISNTQPKADIDFLIFEMINIEH